MPNPSIAESVLTLFTTPDRASSITGELTEEARSRGRLWFWSHVIRTALSLFWRDLASAPARIAGLVALGLCMFVGLFFLSGFGLDLLFDRLLGLKGGVILPSWFVLSGLVAPYLIALVLTRLAPGREMTCVAATVIVGETFNFALIGVTLLPAPDRNGWVWFVFAMFLIAAGPALIAGASQRHRTLRGGA